MSDCIFCKIIAGEIPCNKVYEDELCYGFYDVAPMAPVHILIVPKIHMASLAEVTAETAPVIGHIHGVIAKLAGELGIEKGFRVVTNCGDLAGQSVHHLHFHMLSGKQLGSFD